MPPHSRAAATTPRARAAGALRCACFSSTFPFSRYPHFPAKTTKTQSASGRQRQRRKRPLGGEDGDDRRRHAIHRKGSVQEEKCVKVENSGMKKWRGGCKGANLQTESEENSGKGISTLTAFAGLHPCTPATHFSAPHQHTFLLPTNTLFCSRGSRGCSRPGAVWGW